MALLLPLPAAADMHALGGKLGTTGTGFEYTYSWGELPLYAVRLNLNIGAYATSRDKDDVTYRGRAEFNSLMLFGDVHPFSNGFRVSAGLAFNDNKFRARAEPQGATININDVPYPSNAVENPRGEVTFQTLSPYMGVGWGAAPRGKAGVFYSFDFGVMYARGDVGLSAGCGAALSAADCARLQSDLRAQQAEFKRDLQDYRLYPVLTFGAGYRF